MTSDRPDPDQLLTDLQASRQRRERGQLKIFLGYAAGVGKTYSMLENARRALATGREVVIGYVEPHARPDTLAMVDQLEVIPALVVTHRGVQVREFDVDAALQRHPDLLLVDELAHTNAEGCRHAKRWQDIDELLSAGVDVWTTLNVQHIESLNDVIAQVTGVAVRETIPDSVFEAANEIELIDIPPDDLVARLEQGKIYAPEQAQRALLSFFQRPNLNALRELSLRLAARRIHTDVEDSRRGKRATQPWNTAERLMVCVGPSPTTARVVRAAKRLADTLDAPWLAASVETARTSTNMQSVQTVVDHFRLAESLGAETITLYGDDVPKTLLQFAQSRNVTRIIVGKTTESRWRRILFGNLVDRLLEGSANIDIVVIQGATESSPPTDARPSNSPWSWPLAAASLGIIAACCLFALVLRSFRFADAEANTVMIFLVGVALVAFLYGRSLAVLACCAAVLTFDFVFVPPYFTFAVSDAQYLVTFVIMLMIGIGISSLTARLRQQIRVTQQREARTAALYALGKQLSSFYGRVFLCNAAAAKIAEITSADVVVYLPNANGVVEVVTENKPSITSHGTSLGAAQWVTDHGQMAGMGTDTLPAASALFVPLVGAQSCLGAVAIGSSHDSRAWLAPDHRHLLEACASQLALALERDQLVIEAADARIEAETEHMRSSLLSSVSHDLRTPLATIGGASSSLLNSSNLSTEVRQELLKSIADETSRLSRLLENILQMSKLESGRSAINRQWHVVEELVGVALKRTQSALRHHQVIVKLPAQLPLIFVDGLLMEQLLVNLLENAARHTPHGTQVVIEARADQNTFELAVADSGPGIERGLEQKVFEKFFRATTVPDSVRGSGLGLAICQAIAQSHHGSMQVRHNSPVGAIFVLQLPLEKPAPLIQEMEPPVTP